MSARHQFSVNSLFLAQIISTLRFFGCTILAGFLASTLFCKQNVQKTGLWIQMLMFIEDRIRIRSFYRRMDPDIFRGSDPDPFFLGDGSGSAFFSRRSDPDSTLL